MDTFKKFVIVTTHQIFIFIYKLCSSSLWSFPQPLINYFLSFMFKYSPHLAIRHSYSMFFLQGKRPSFTSTQTNKSIIVFYILIFRFFDRRREYRKFWMVATVLLLHIRDWGVDLLLSLLNVLTLPHCWRMSASRFCHFTRDETARDTHSWSERRGEEENPCPYRESNPGCPACRFANRPVLACFQNQHHVKNANGNHFSTFLNFPTFNLGVTVL
jgi:hypothetical protein